MLIYPCFNYISPFQPNTNIQKCIDSDIDFNNLCRELSELSDKYSDYEEDLPTLYTQILNTAGVVNDIKEISLKYADKINSQNMCPYYVWFDSINKVRVDGNKSTIINNPILNISNDINERQIERVKTVVEARINNLYSLGEYDPNNFHEDIYIVFIDLTVRGEPTFIIYPDFYNM